jgi:TM2 domain-containing membrane protein YozV
MENICPQCGAPVNQGEAKCAYCGAVLSAPVAPVQPQVQPVYVNNTYVAPNNGINPAWPIKSKIVAGILAILLGSLGIHKFYLGKSGQGILMLLFFWTYIPGIIGFIEGIIILCSNDHNFQTKYQCRLQ